MTLSWGELHLPPINLNNMPNSNPAPTDQETPPSSYRLRASPHFLIKLQKMRRGDVSVEEFNEAVKTVVASHNLNLFFQVGTEDE